MASGRSSVEYWPKDEAWRQVPLEGRRKLGFKLQPICNAFQHRGEIMQIDEFSRRYNVPLYMPALLVQMRLHCRDCNLPAGYFYW